MKPPQTAATNTYVHIFADLALWEKSDNKLCTNCDYIHAKAAVHSVN